MLNIIKSVMLGHAIGDALGVPVEFCKRKDLEQHPVTDMIGYGSYHVPAGCWSDDTSMSLCALESLAKGTVDFDDIMNNFGKWLYNNYFTATGIVFDVGNKCDNAIANYFELHYPAVKCGKQDERSNGNGSLMRINPFVLYAYYNKLDDYKFVNLISQASSLTHAHSCSIDGCIIYSYILKELINNPAKASVYKGLNNAKRYISYLNIYTYYNRLYGDDISKIDESKIKSSGYIVDTLEAAIWCLLTTNDYKSCVLKAVNLGEDTDTIAAIAGGLAGALYGMENIPADWLNKLKKRNYIENMCEQAYDAWR